MSDTRNHGELPPRVLIVEDNVSTAKALRVQFHQRAGWGALVAHSLAEGRFLLREHPAAVLLDLGLPDGRGEDLIEDIRERCPTARVVVVTGQPEGCEWMARVEAMGPDHVAYKPYDIDLLIAAVRGPIPAA